MKKLLFAALICSCAILVSGFVERGALSSSESLVAKTHKAMGVQTGDIIFQSSKSGQGHAIQLATGSKYSHVGLIYEIDGEWMVFEAVQPVQLISLTEFAQRGDGTYVISRLKNADVLLTPAVIQNMKASIKKYIGKNYDMHFDWSDERMYCSELVWKIYKEALGIEIGQTKPLKSYDLSHPVVKKTMEERYGKDIPLDEPMISPGAMFDSELLTVVQNTMH